MIKKGGYERMQQMYISRVRMHDGEIEAVRRFREFNVIGLALTLVLFSSAIFAVVQIKLE
jgi:hypothetical protein